ncbi:MAG: hypothetical protein ACM3SS_18985 [Rhodospirillaceae bacterium]
MLRVLTVISLLSFSSTAHALWDFTLSAWAISSTGVYGRETVTYRYDPADITMIECTGASGPCTVPAWWTYPVSDTWIQGAPYTLAYGPIVSVTYSGVVNGAGGPSIMNAFDDDGLGCTKNIGGTRFLEECNGLLDFKYPVAGTSTVLLPVFWPSGGEDGFRWVSAENQLGLVRSFAPVALNEPGSVALLIACLIGIGVTCRLPALRLPATGSVNS